MNNFKIEMMENETKYSNSEVANAVRNDLLQDATNLGYDEATWFNVDIETEGNAIRLTLTTHNGDMESFQLTLIGKISDIVYYCNEDTDSPIFSFHPLEFWDSIIETIEFQDGNQQSRNLCLNGNSFFQLYQDTEYIDN